MPEFSDYVEGLDPVVGALAGDEIVPVSKDGDAASVTTQQIANLGGGGSVTSVSGTTNRITSTGGATPVIDIDAAYDAAVTAEIAAAVTTATLVSATTSVAGATITLDMDSKIQKLFVGSASFLGAKTIAMSNVTNALSFTFTFEVTNVAAVLTVPADWLMSSPDFDGVDWTPPATGKFVFGGVWDGTNWFVNAAGPYN